MTDPVTATIAGVSLVSTALGSLTSASGAAFTGQAQSNMYNYQAGVAQINQQIMAQNASWATEEGEVSAQQQGIKTQAQIATTEAQQGAGGLDVASGSNARVRASELEIGEEDQALIRSNAAQRAYGYEVQGFQYAAQASADTASATNSQTAAKYNVTSSLLSGASSVASKWVQGSSTGIFGGGSSGTVWGTSSS